MDGPREPAKGSAGQRPQGRLCPYVYPGYRRCNLYCRSGKVYRDHALKEHQCHVVRGSAKLHKLPPEALAKRMASFNKGRKSGAARRREKRKAEEAREQAELDRLCALADARRERQRQRVPERDAQGPSAPSDHRHLHRRQGAPRAPGSAQGPSTPSSHRHQRQRAPPSAAVGRPPSEPPTFGVPEAREPRDAQGHRAPPVIAIARTITTG